MPLDGIVKPAAPGIIGWDTNVKLSRTGAKAQYNKGYRFCFRYLSRATKQGSNDLSAAEAAIILGAGLSLGAGQYGNYAVPAGASPGEVAGLARRLLDAISRINDGDPWIARQRGRNVSVSGGVSCPRLDHAAHV